MSYVLNQYNQPVVDKTSASSSDNVKYMTLLTGGEAKRKRNIADNATSEEFYDECIRFDSTLSIERNYYFHCKIKRLLYTQTFYIYLINYESVEEDMPTQYIKTITVNGGDTNEWVDFELIFTPLDSRFNCILFDLQRTIKDYTEAVRYPYICYEEISQIKNLVTTQTGAQGGLFKIGIQSRPGLMTCLNNEEIHVGRSGVYEVRRGDVTVDFLGVVSAAEENATLGPNNSMTLEEYLAYLASRPVETDPNRTNSACIFNNSKQRKIDAFTLDYMYEVREA